MLSATISKYSRKRPFLNNLLQAISTNIANSSCFDTIMTFLFKKSFSFNVCRQSQKKLLQNAGNYEKESTLVFMHWVLLNKKTSTHRCLIG